MYRYLNFHSYCSKGAYFDNLDIITSIVMWDAVETMDSKVRHNRAKDDKYVHPAWGDGQEGASGA